MKKIKRGLYLDILENANMAKMKYTKDERKYDIKRILESQKQYEQDNQLRFETAAQRQKAYQQKLQKRYYTIKMMKNTGVY